MKKPIREWVRKGEGEWRVANREAAQADPVRDAVCFHCQECREVPEGDSSGTGAIDLETSLQRLFVDLLPSQPSLKPLRRAAVSLSQYGIDSLYPGFSTTTRKMHAALRHAERVRLQARAILGLPS